MGEDLTIKLKEEQLKLSNKIITRDSFKKIKTIAGVDQAFTDDGKIISAVVVCDYKTMKIIEKKYAISDINMPYIPGYLGFREGPVIVEAFEKLEEKPDILIVDGSGILHPRRIGMASHVGLLLDIPTVGLTKNLLIGRQEKNLIYVGNELRGIEIKTKEYTKPLYISPGHNISLTSCTEIIKHCLKEHKLPEPLNLAHKYANKIKRELKESNKKA